MLNTENGASMGITEAEGRRAAAGGKPEQGELPAVLKDFGFSLGAANKLEGSGKLRPRKGVPQLQLDMLTMGMPKLPPSTRLLVTSPRACKPLANRPHHASKTPAAATTTAPTASTSVAQHRRDSTASVHEDMLRDLPMQPIVCEMPTRASSISKKRPGSLVSQDIVEVQTLSGGKVSPRPSIAVTSPNQLHDLLGEAGLRSAHLRSVAPRDGNSRSSGTAARRSVAYREGSCNPSRSTTPTMEHSRRDGGSGDRGWQDECCCGLDDISSESPGLVRASGSALNIDDRFESCVVSAFQRIRGQSLTSKLDAHISGGCALSVAPTPEEAEREYERIQSGDARRVLKFSLGKKPLSERLKRLDARRVRHVRNIRVERWQQMRQRQFDLLPTGEAEALKTAFSRFDIDQSGFLDASEVFECLKELGIYGRNAEEKREALKICRKATHAVAGDMGPRGDRSTHELGLTPGAMSTNVDDPNQSIAVDLLEFGLVVVPCVRQRLHELRSDDLLKQFFKFDLDGSRVLTKKQVTELGRAMGIDQRMIRKATEGRRDDEEIEFEAFHELIERGREYLNRVIRDRERAVQEETSLSQQKFVDFREDLVSLYSIFCRYDLDRSGTLSRTEIDSMLKEFGLTTRSAQERADIENILRDKDRNADGVFSFPEFLEVVRQIRCSRQEKSKREQLARFDRYDRDKSGFLCAAEVSLLLADLGFVPQNFKEQEELGLLISSVDKDGSGFIDFQEFQTLSQRIDEKLKSFRYEAELDMALRLGFCEKHMRDLRLVFDTLDIDGSNKLDENEVKTGLTMLRKQVTAYAFDAAFKSLDQDGSGELEFTEFLHFMKIMRDSEGISAEDSQRLAKKAMHLSTRVLQRVLEYFRLGRQYIMSLCHDELVDLFCDYFRVSPNTNIHDVLDVKTVGELFEAAQKRDLQLQSMQ